MHVVIKKMETDEEILGKAYVHWKAWHEAYPGIVSSDYLERMTLEKCETLAFRWKDDILVAEEDGRVIGFLGYGNRGEEAPSTGEIFALYVLKEYYGTGLGQKLMEEGLKRLEAYPEICLWVLKENRRAIRFYEKCGFVPDGAELYNANVSASEIRMVLIK